MVMLTCYICWCVFLVGNAVAYRRARRNRVGFAHKVKREESMKWFQQKVHTNNFDTFIEQYCSTQYVVNFIICNVKSKLIFAIQQHNY